MSLCNKCSNKYVNQYLEIPDSWRPPVWNTDEQFTIVNGYYVRVGRILSSQDLRVSILYTLPFIGENMVDSGDLSPETTKEQILDMLNDEDSLFWTRGEQPRKSVYLKDCMRVKSI